MKRLGRYVIILALIIFLWNTGIIKPLRLFAVFLHELGHAFAAFIFGYGIEAFSVNFNESGYTLVQGKGWFSSFVISNGGYMGNVLFALLILYLKETFFRKFILGSVAILLLAVSIRYSGFSFTLLYAVTFAGFVILLYMLQNEKLNDWVIDIIGVSGVAYAIYDTFVDTILIELNRYFQLIQGWGAKRPMTDAVRLAEMTGVPAVVWGAIWLALAFLAVYVVFTRKKPVRLRK